MSVNFMSGFKFEILENYDHNGSTLPSPDQLVGFLEVNEVEVKLEQCERDNLDYYDNGFNFLSGKTYNEKNILVILESPHRFEYDSSKKPIALIMGKTGCLFFDNFADAISKSELKMKPGKYNLILANAIQYQTSCGLNPINRVIRDKNWLDVFDNFGGKLDLKNRIFAIKPRYTINLCTGGRNPEGLRSVVSASLKEFGLKKNKHFTEGSHPASWDYQKASKKQLIY